MEETRHYIGADRMVLQPVGDCGDQADSLQAGVDSERDLAAWEVDLLEAMRYSQLLCCYYHGTLCLLGDQLRV